MLFTSKMKVPYRFAVLWLLLTVAGCRPAHVKLSSEIEALEKQLLNDSLGTVNRDKALELVKLYEDYAAARPGDTLSAYYLFKAGDVSNGTGDYQAAIRYYGQCSKMESFPRKEVAFFLQGFIYENQLNDLDNARRIYSEFLRLYPDHTLVRDVQFSLDNLGKSPEDLIRMFEQRDSLEQIADTTAIL